MVVTRKEWGDSRADKPASWKRRLTMQQTSIAVMLVPGELAGLAISRPERGRRRRGTPGIILFEVMPDRDLSALAVLLIKVEHALVAGVVEAAALQRGQISPRSLKLV